MFIERPFPNALQFGSVHYIMVGNYETGCIIYGAVKRLADLCGSVITRGRSRPGRAQDLVRGGGRKCIFSSLLGPIHGC